MQKRIILSGILIGVAVVALLIGISVTTSIPQQTQVTSMAMTVDPSILANMTQVANATPLSDVDAEKYVSLREQVNACDDYDEQRKSQMLQHIEWMIDPSEIPADVMLAFGTNQQESLVFGMASFTQIQWRLLERPADSCLIDIGRDLNGLLEVYGRPIITIYDE